MRRFTLTFSLALTLSTPSFAAKAKNPVAERLNEAGVVFSEIMSAPDKGIPRDLIEKSHCVVVVPGLKKGAFIVGAKYGKGFITCRKDHHGWSAPAAVRVEGGSFGFQIGGSETDVVLLVMNERGANRLLSSQFTLGGEGEILSWSRSRGVFAGISLQGATLRQDLDDNEALYGKKLENRDIVRGHVAAPRSAAKLLGLLNKYSPREHS